MRRGNFGGLGRPDAMALEQVPAVYNAVLYSAFLTTNGFDAVKNAPTPYHALLLADAAFHYGAGGVVGVTREAVKSVISSMTPAETQALESALRRPLADMRKSADLVYKAFDYLARDQDRSKALFDGMADAGYAQLGKGGKTVSNGDVDRLEFLRSLKRRID